MGKAITPVIISIFFVLFPLISTQMRFVLGCHVLEREALIKFKQVLNQSASPVYSWMGEDCCRWQGVTCDNVTQHVRSLDLHVDRSVCDSYDLYACENELGASKFDASLLELRQLRYLDLSGNTFIMRRIPEFKASMKHLRYLNLSYAGLSGVVPPHLGKLTRLQALDLSRNSLEGPISHFLSNMSSLRSLILSGNKFNGSIPLLLKNMRQLEFLNLELNSFSQVEGGTIMGILGNLCHLKVLKLSDNHFHGEDILSHHLKNSSRCGSYDLETLHLGSNDITGTLPFWLGELKNLRFLDLRFNNIIGTLPFWLRELKNLRFLDLRFNNIIGTLPFWLGEFKNLRFLDLSLNNITGTLSFSLGELKNLRFLDLSSNNITGTLPFSLGELKNLRFLDLSSNNVTGTLPFSLGELKNLKFLALDNNRLHGPISPSIGNLPLLEELHLRGCGLTISLNGGGYLKIGNLTSLKVLDLSYNPLNFNGSFDKLPTFQLRELRMRSCKIEGQFPEWIKMQNELIVLDISNNGIFGELAKWIPGVKLDQMNLSYNHFVGPMPSFPSSSALSSIDLSYNSFSGPLLRDSSFPLCNLEKLALLDLKHNQLSGTIPDCWHSNHQLTAIDMSSNNLSGPIPSTFGLNLQKLLYLKLNNNSLEGEIPSTLEFTDLSILDLGENKLTGSIPNWGESGYSFTNLAILRIRDNQLEGIIPPRLCSLEILQILDLAKNNLTGTIPSCFGQLLGMGSTTHVPQKFVAMSPTEAEGPGAVMTFTNPHEDNAVVVLKGEELQYTTTLEYVIDLDLSCNGFVGAIPQELTYLSGLIGLNLSHNHLTGSIPDKVGEMGSLESLDLSNNHLSGTIPSSMAALTSLSSLNLSSNKLHGEIPTGSQLRTLNDPSIYAGNAGLCGHPLPNECAGKHGQLQQQQHEEDGDEDEDTLEKVLFYVVIMLGFATGFWGVVGSLFLKKTWRHAMFRRVEDITDYLYMQVVVRINRLIKS